MSLPDVRDRRALYDSMIEGKLDENPNHHNESQELDAFSHAHQFPNVQF